MSEASAPQTISANIDLIKFKFDKGNLVMVQARTYPGINKLGGVGRITKRYENESNEILYDVKYVLGGSEKAVAEVYILPVNTDTDTGFHKSMSLDIKDRYISKETVEQDASGSEKSKKRESLSPTSSNGNSNNFNHDGDNDSKSEEAVESHEGESKSKKAKRATKAVMTGKKKKSSAKLNVTPIQAKGSSDVDIDASPSNPSTSTVAFSPIISTIADIGASIKKNEEEKESLAAKTEIDEEFEKNHLEFCSGVSKLFKYGVDFVEVDEIKKIFPNQNEEAFEKHLKRLEQDNRIFCDENKVYMI